MFHEYPYTDFHELNLDWLLCECRRSIGLGLNVSGNKLRLVNAGGEVLSEVTVSYADAALKDVDGRPIKTYLLSAGTDSTHVIFTKGDGTTTSITVPYAVVAKEDVNGHDIEDYVYNLSIAGDKLRFTKGDGTVIDLEIPYAVKASTDAEGKDITTYAASLSVDGNNVVLRDSKGILLNSITVPYATAAGTADEATHADDADHADEADLATVAEDANNAVESVTISGDNIIFTTFDGQSFSITSPFAVKAQKDDLGNVIKNTYIAGVTQNAGTGKMVFSDAMGNTVVELTPIASTAINDNYNNLIADFVKTIAVSQNSNYVTVTHGTGTVDTLTIHYSETAWKDTNGNVIKNTYVKNMECIEDVDDGHWKLVAYNGDTPQAELFRFEVYAYAAQCDVNGKLLTSYLADVDINANNNPIFLDGEGNEVAGISGSVTITPAGTVAVTLTSGTLPSASYDSGTQTLTFNPGAFPTVDSTSFTGTQSTNKVDFAQ